MTSPNAKFWAAVATLVGFLLTKFGLPLDPDVADAVSTVIVVLGPALVWRVPNRDPAEKNVGLPYRPTTYKRQDGHLDLSTIVAALLILLVVALLMRLL